MGSIKKEFFNAMIDDFNEYRYHGNPDLGSSNNQTFEKTVTKYEWQGWRAN